MTSSDHIKETGTKADNPAQILEDTWTTPKLPLDGPHAVLAISRGTIRLSHITDLMMAIDLLIRSA